MQKKMGIKYSRWIILAGARVELLASVTMKKMVPLESVDIFGRSSDVYVWFTGQSQRLNERRKKIEREPGSGTYL